MKENLVLRRSCKKYRGDMVPDELIDKVIKAGLYAPSGMNKQAPIILAIKDKNLRDRLERMNAEIAGMRYDGKPFYNAPVVLVVLADKNVSTYKYDGALCLDNMLNEAYNLGLGSCWIHRAKEEFESEEGKAILNDLGVLGEYEGIGHCIIGYSDGYEPKEKLIKDNRVFKK